MLPQRTTFLIVGAGPTGLACAIAMVKQGCKPEDIVIVDAVMQGQNTSRAMAIHAATLEVAVLLLLMQRGVHTSFLVSGHGRLRRSAR